MMVAKLENMIGQIFPTNNCGNLEIIEYINKRNVTVRFLNTNFITNVELGDIRRGNVRDYLMPSVYNVGIIDIKYPAYFEGKMLLEYQIWHDMLRRCYDQNWQIRHPSYEGCLTSKNFAYYPFFYEWCNDQIGFGNLDWQLDKDLLVKGNKVYSEDTCIFIPREINVALTHNRTQESIYPTGVNLYRSGRFQSQIMMYGKKRYLGYFDTPEEAFLAYKQSKEQYLQSLAYKWEPYIDSRAFEALLHYQLEITD